MSRATRVMAGLILISIPTIAFGGYFLLSSLIDKSSGYAANALRQDFFRAGHAHAGVITLLSLIGQMLVDAAALSPALQWLARLGIPLSGIMLSAGFFTSMLPPTATTPGPAVALIYVGAALLVLSVVTLGVGLLRSGARTR
jgi:Ni,Fe-hydrogenase I cytochrome b subunit